MFYAKVLLAVLLAGAAEQSVVKEVRVLEGVVESGKATDAELKNLFDLYVLTSQCGALKKLATRYPAQGAKYLCHCGEACSATDAPQLSAISALKTKLQATDADFFSDSIQKLWTQAKGFPEAWKSAEKHLRHSKYEHVAKARKLKAELQHKLKSLE